MKHDIYYTEREGGSIIHSKIKISQERQKTWCEAQALNEIDPYHRVTISDGNTTIKAAAVFFLDGYIWDAILSGYDSTRGFKYTKTGKPIKKLPMCTKLPYWRCL